MSGTTETARSPADAGSSSFVRNALSSYGVRAIYAVSALLVTPYLYRRLGPTGFGAWSVVFVFSTVAILLQMGFANAVTKFVAQQRAANRPDEVARTVTAAAALMVMIGAAAGGLCVVAAFVLQPLAGDGYGGAFRTGMIALGVAFVIRLPMSAYAAALVGYHRYDMANIGAAVTPLSFAVGAVIAVEAGAGVTGVELALAGSLVLGGLCSVLALRHVDRDLPLWPRRDRAERRRLAGFGVFALLADTMVFISQNLDTVTIAAITGAAAAGPYAAVVKLQSGVQSITAPFTALLMPMVSDLSARGEHAEVTRRLALTMRVTLQLTLPVAAAVAIFAHDLVGVWLGSDVPSSTAHIVVALMLVQMITISVGPATEALIGVGSVRAVAGLAVAEGLLNLSLTIVLVALHGAVGAAVASVFATATIAPWRLPIAARATGAQLGALVRSGLAIPVASTLPALAAMLTVHSLVDGGLGRLVLGAAAGLSVALLLAIAQVGPRRLRSMARVRRAAVMPS